MKYTDLFENRKEEFEDDLTRAAMDLLVLYQAAGATSTNLNNISDELKKDDYSVDMETLSGIVEQLGFSVNNQVVKFVDDEDDLELEDGEEYDEVENMAKTATDKRLK